MHKIDVLDHGYVILRNLSGPVRRVWHRCDDMTMEKDYDADDTDPAITARMSFNKMDKERTREDDLKLIKYLMKNKHTTPIEMIECWIEMKMPIFVARQFVRHRTVTINEVSARYVTLPEEWYIPEKVGGKAINAKQGQEDNLDPAVQQLFKDNLDAECDRSYRIYVNFIKRGVAPEHARMFLHVNHYTHWIWKQNLHNLMHFLSLRMDSHAQYEARMYANAIHELLSNFLPDLMLEFDNQRKGE